MNSYEAFMKTYTFLDAMHIHIHTPKDESTFFGRLSKIFHSCDVKFSEDKQEIETGTVKLSFDIGYSY